MGILLNAVIALSTAAPLLPEGDRWLVLISTRGPAGDKRAFCIRETACLVEAIVAGERESFLELMAARALFSLASAEADADEEAGNTFRFPRTGPAGGDHGPAAGVRAALEGVPPLLLPAPVFTIKYDEIETKNV